MKTLQFPGFRPKQAVRLRAKISLRDKGEEDLFFQGKPLSKWDFPRINPYNIDMITSWSIVEPHIRELGTALQRVMDFRDETHANIIQVNIDGQNFLLRIAHRRPPIFRSVADLRQLMYPSVANKFYRDKLCVVCELDVLSEGGRHHPDCPVAIFDGES